MVADVYYVVVRGETRALIGGGGGRDIRVLPTSSFLKKLVGEITNI